MTQLMAMVILMLAVLLPANFVVATDFRSEQNQTLFSRTSRILQFHGGGGVSGGLISLGPAPGPAPAPAPGPSGSGSTSGSGSGGGKSGGKGGGGIYNQSVTYYPDLPDIQYEGWPDGLIPKENPKQYPLRYNPVFVTRKDVRFTHGYYMQQSVDKLQEGYVDKITTAKQRNRLRCQKMVVGGKPVNLSPQDNIQKNVAKDGECLVCKPGFILAKGGICYMLDAFCEEYLSNGQCKRCAQGLKFNIHKMCVPDFSQCRLYFPKSPEVCAECQPNYIPTNMGCARKQQVCSRNDPKNAKKCAMCRSPFVTTAQGSCLLKTEESCGPLNSWGKCEYCKQPESYDFRNGQCILKLSVFLKHKKQL